MALPWSLAEKLGVAPEKTSQRRLAASVSAAAATAQTHYIDLPTDHFIHSILLECLENSTLDDCISELRVIGEGSRYFKKMTGGMCKEISISHFEKMATGYYKVYFKDPRIGLAKPLPSWVLTSLQLEIDDIAPAATKKNTIRTTIVEEKYQNQDLSNWKVLVEKYLKWSHFGTDTLEQEYKHERNFDVFGYLYAMDDNATLSDTIFDKLTFKGFTPEEEITMVNSIYISQLKRENADEFKNALDTGYTMLEFPRGLSSRKFTSLYSYLNIPTAGANAGVRVLERYLV